MIKILQDVNRRYIFSCMFQAMSVDHKHTRTNNLHPKRHPFILLFVASTTMRLFSSVAPRRHVFSTPRSFASWRLFNKSNASPQSVKKLHKTSSRQCGSVMPLPSPSPPPWSPSPLLWDVSARRLSTRPVPCVHLPPSPRLTGQLPP